ncbi:TetR family transcriptional regulator [Rhodococcoides trifolii]|uniref:TetR family transcriptional regulator n=1 Tax=Rhodococcoides trifolii TaxID=908250 RepID=A0A917G2H4_9NOCA|nr:TetR/AcrR family transcriptional regulator [Rhodococcus trifolii]GGG19807.1 TetR family transcriptional regulator [Rhodococcus trifolii]
METRRADTRATIVEVAARLLSEGGSGAVTTRRVADEAGVQAPTIYRLFGDKDGLLDAVAEHVMATYVSAKAEIVEAASHDQVDPVEDLRRGWDAQIDFGVANPTLFTLLSNPDRRSRSVATQSGLDVLAARVRRVAAAGRLRVSEQRAVDMIHAAGTGTILSILSSPPDARDPELATQMLDAVLATVLTDGTVSTDTRHVSAAIALTAVASELPALSRAEQQLLAEWLSRVVDAS